MRKGVAASVLLIAFLGAAVYAVAAQKKPKFVDYPASLYTGLKAAIRLDTVHPLNVDRIRPYLQRGYAGPINFAGHYVFVVLEAGQGCETGAAIDVRTGQVHELDVAACHWRENDSMPFYMRADSKLLILSGSVGWEGKRGAHYFVFEDGKFLALDKRKKGQFLSELFGGGEEAPEIDRDTALLLGKAGVEVVEAMEPQERKEFLAEIQPSVSENAEEVTVPTSRPETEKGRKISEGLEKAVMFAVHRPLFNKNLISDTSVFGHKEAKSISENFYKTSIKREIKHNNSNYIVLYNMPSDLFAIININGDEEAFAGFVPGQQISEELYRVADGEDLMENVLTTRPAVVQKFFNDFADLPEPEKVFSLFMKSESRSIPVNRNLLAFAKLVEPIGPCSSAFKKVLDGGEFAFQDGKRPQDVGPFYLSVWLPIKIKDEKGIRVAVSFHDVKTSKYVGYLIYDPAAESDCKVEKIITSVFTLN